MGRAVWSSVATSLACLPALTSAISHPLSISPAGQCPNDCSGNGECKLLGDLADVLTIPYASTNWDVDRIQTCVCDNGFFGPDCSQRE